MSKTIQIYSAESKVRKADDVIRDMARGLVKGRYIAYRLARNNIAGEYSRSLLGFFWDFADPLVLAIIFYILRQGKVFSTGETNMPYAVYLIFGLLMYQSFVNATMWTINVLNQSRNLITQQKLPPESLLLSVFLRAMFFAIFRIAVMLLFALFLGSYSAIGMIKFLLAYPVLILAGMSIGVFLAPFNAVYRDVGRFVGMILVPLRFISPVLFVLPKTPVYEAINSVNSFALIMMNLRSLATLNTTEYLGLTMIHCAVLFLFGLVGWFIFHVSVPVLSERA
ncbi:MAG: ABC transporter permease [Candidatus Hydrogenedentes bacterium]|nr:ABC transporter permease [Candidatus Hydrogenedentota bacterium]